MTSSPRRSTSFPGWLPTGAVSCEEAFPSVAGAALHPGPDDPGHVHPHFTFTGQLSQHQAVHVAMREATGLILQTCLGSCRRHRFLPHHWSTLKHFPSRAEVREAVSAPKPQEVHYTDFQEEVDEDRDRGHCRLCEMRG